MSETGKSMTWTSSIAQSIAGLLLPMFAFLLAQLAWGLLPYSRLRSLCRNIAVQLLALPPLGRPRYQLRPVNCTCASDLTSRCNRPPASRAAAETAVR
jgi:hypothetical protein